MELEFPLLEHTLALIKANPEETLDGIRLRALFIERSGLVADPVGSRAQQTVQPQATSVNYLTEEVGHERGFGRHREREYLSGSSLDCLQHHEEQRRAGR